MISCFQFRFSEVAMNALGPLLDHGQSSLGVATFLRPEFLRDYKLWVVAS